MEPFAGRSDDDIDNLTSREIYDRIYKPGMDRQKAMEAAMKGHGPAVELDPKTPEEHAAAVAAVKALLGGGKKK